ncbi:outer membrane protein assembly factor BamE [Lichenihabitans psoromatis]|uniref:outer membrane protein assembly factor BamE n=1 Tax=Lichenihabitans psoromatis TaxID=2528642 RepID=UPI001035A679|nr:outer membrane protein assembly factor BamE [Lichenihabitans psoromatis]
MLRSAQAIFPFPSLARWASVAVLGLSLGGCLGYDGEYARGYVVDQHALDQVKVGSSAEQVLVVLGTPSTTSTIGGSAWYYISQKVDRPLAYSAAEVTDQRVMAVYFTPQKKVERIANYGMQDGKVFDFISRTTPTGGAEQGFVKNLFRNLLRF